MPRSWIMLNTVTGQRKAVSDCVRLFMPAQWVTAYRTDDVEQAHACEHGHPRCALEAQPFNYCVESHQ